MTTTTTTIDLSSPVEEDPTWPIATIPSPKYYREYRYKPQVINDMEAGYGISRPQATRSRWVFILGWEFLPNSEYLALHDFFDQYQGHTFQLTHPIRGTVHTVRFTEDKLPESVPSGHTIGGELAWDMPGIMLMEQ